MSQYKVMKTTMGRKYRMRMADNEVSERELFRLAVVVVPFLGTVLLLAAWLVRG